MAVHRSTNSYLFLLQFNKMFGLPEKPSQPKGASLNGNLLGVDEFSMLQPSKDVQKVCYGSNRFFSFLVCLYVWAFYFVFVSFSVQIRSLEALGI